MISTSWWILFIQWNQWHWNHQWFQLVMHEWNLYGGEEFSNLMKSNRNSMGSREIPARAKYTLRRQGKVALFSNPINKNLKQVWSISKIFKDFSKFESVYQVFLNNFKCLLSICKGSGMPYKPYGTEAIISDHSFYRSSMISHNHRRLEPL